MLPYLRLGPFLLQTTGLALLLGIWVGSWLAEKEAARLKIQPDLVYNLIFFGLVGGLIGARLAYAATYLNAYLANPLSLFAINTNTLSPFEGLLIGLLVAFVYGQRKGLQLRPMLDALAPGIGVFMIFLGIAHLLNGDAYGAPTKLPWGIFLWSDYRQPTQIYEMLLAAGVLLVILNHPLEKMGSGLNFLLTLFLSAAARIFLEAFRGDSLIWPGGFRAAQVISLIVLAGSLILIRVWSQSPAKAQDQESIKGKAMDNT
jgi:phosphatidylglycerol:prolipoprotein diacylglycerol transferase